MDEEMAAKRGDRPRLMTMEEVPSYVLEKPSQQRDDRVRPFSPPPFSPRFPC